MIKIIKSYKTVYPPKDGFTLYTLGVEFEDGDKGLAFAKSEHPPYKSGDEVEVSLAGETGNGTAKYKISKVDSERPSSSPPTSGPRESSQSQQSSSRDSQASSGAPERNGQRDGMIMNNAVAIYIAQGCKDDLGNIALMVERAAIAMEQGSPVGSSPPPFRDTTDYSDAGSEERIEF